MLRVLNSAICVCRYSFESLCSSISMAILATAIILDEEKEAFNLRVWNI